MNTSIDYKEASLNTLLKLGLTGDIYACLELSVRHAKGTWACVANDRLSSYWQQKANGIEPNLEDQVHALDVYKARFSKDVYLQMTDSNSVLVCLSLSKICRKEGDNEEGKKWFDKAISLISPQERSSSNNSLIDYEPINLCEYFKENLSNWYGENEEFGGDCSTYIQHKKMNDVLLPLFRQNFKIPLNEEILFTRDTSFWSNANQGLVLTDQGIYCIADNDNPQDEFVLSWTSIDHVEYKEYCFYFYNKDGEQLAFIASNFFFKNISPEKFNGQGIGGRLAGHFTKMAQLAGEEKWVYENVANLEDAKKYDEALAELDLLSKDTSILEDPSYHFLRGRILLKKEWTIDDNRDEKRFNEIDKEFQKARELTEDENLRCNCAYWQAYNYLLYGRFYMARNYFISSMESDSEEIREDSKIQFEFAEEKLSDLWSNYTNQYKYEERKFIMPINDYSIAGCNVNGIDTFRLSNIPSCIKFPMGHPIANELYIGHPYNPGLYVPYENSEDIFFVDKIHELCYLLECLGAEEISITSIKGKNVSELGEYDSLISGSADAMLFSVNGEVSRTRNNERTSSSNVHRTLSQKFDPMKKPYVPDGLIWYQEQAKWQRLVNSRLNGNLLEYNEFVSTADTKFVSNTERNNIKASAEYLWNKLDGSAEINSKEQFKESTETQWKVEVKFRSIKLFADDVTSATSSKQQTTVYSASEQEYVDNLKEFLEDDAALTPRERKMLDRIRQSLGISEERAKELEASLTKPQLTEDEREYLDMFHEYAEKGEVTEKERRRLDKFAAAMGITAERVKEIEKV